MDANVLSYRTEEEQKVLCANTCYETLTIKYQVLLQNNCFASSDVYEQANANLQAKAYEIACQTTADGSYCSMYPSSIRLLKKY